MGMQRFLNVNNKHQGPHKRVLCVCSIGMLRSATAAVVLSQEPFNYNTRAVGVDSDALIVINHYLLSWAHEIVCMEQRHARIIGKMLTEYNLVPPRDGILCLNIPDNFDYRNPQLMALIKESYSDFLKQKGNTPSI